MKFLLGLDHQQHLTGRKHVTELEVVFLLELLDLQVDGIHILDGLQTGGIVAGINVAIPPHLIEQHPLFALHLLVDREKRGSLLWRQSGLGDDKLLHLGFKALGVEAALLLSPNLQCA